MQDKPHIANTTATQCRAEMRSQRTATAVYANFSIKNRRPKGKDWQERQRRQCRLADQIFTVQKVL